VGIGVSGVVGLGAVGITAAGTDVGGALVTTDVW
jgi:hypothetical protein